MVSGYTKVEDKFVEAYLNRDSETVEEAKARLKEQIRITKGLLLKKAGVLFDCLASNPLPCYNIRERRV